VSIPTQLSNAASAAAASIPQPKGGLSNPTNEALRDALGSSSSRLSQLQTVPDFSSLVSQVQAVQKEATDQAVRNHPGADPATVLNGVKDAIDPVLGQASYSRPKDVSCSMSVLSWDVSHKAFGRTVADAFLAIQVIVRNLNADNEFLVHDAEFAVDANSAQLSKFQAGNDKELVRSVLQYGQSYDRQHIAINIAEGIGTIMGAIVGLPQPSIDSLVGASGAYHAGLLPFLHVLIPDLTTKNLNTLNDLGFSAASASRVVVPKSGSVPFVIFVPVRPLEQACWLQAKYDIASDSSMDGAWVNICRGLVTRDLKELPFKKWRPVHLQALEKHGYALIAGVHIKATGQAPTLKSIICAAPTDTSGAYLQYAIPSAGLNCSLTGTDLDTVTTLRMRSSADTKTNLDAKVTVSGDNSTATSTFATADVAKIAQVNYELYGVDKSGTETDFNRALAFRLSPTLTASQTISTATTTGTNVTLKGTNLVGIGTIEFFTGATNVAHASIINSDSSSITLAMPTLNAGTYDVKLIIADGTNNGSGTEFDTKISVARQ
jgi:hypothetical protein